MKGDNGRNQGTRLFPSHFLSGSVHLTTFTSLTFHSVSRRPSGPEVEEWKGGGERERYRKRVTDMHSASLSSLTPYRSLSIRASTPLPTVGSALYTRLPLPSVVSLRREWNEGCKA